MAKQTAIKLSKMQKIDMFFDKEYRRHNPTAKAKVRVQMGDRFEDQYTGNMQGNFVLNIKYWNTPVCNAPSFVAKEK
jgi:hypothetical protein